MRDLNEASYKINMLQEEIIAHEDKLKHGNPHTTDYAESKKQIEKAQATINYYKKQIDEYIDWERGTNINKRN